MADPRVPQVQSPEDKLRQYGLAIYQNEQIIKSAKVGSPEYKKADAALKQLRIDFKKVNDEINASRNKTRAAARAKELQRLKMHRLVPKHSTTKRLLIRPRIKLLNLRASRLARTLVRAILVQVVM